MKAAYKTAWQNWRHIILSVSNELNFPFAAPHIERWCNGWQVRVHFFAYFKYYDWQESAAIFSVLLNRRRLTVSLDWHCYKAGISRTTLADYNRWLDVLNRNDYADFALWHGTDDEYADYQTVAQTTNISLQYPDDFYCIGKHLERNQLDNTDCISWIRTTINELQPLYEACHP
ncbi:MAG: HI_0552 family protein [Cardiobacteriaceae bacterium]|nr:HI_0552 family protein [Cardiobacteriaceae bacterium]